MSLKNMTLLAGATLSASGGTSLVFADDSVTIPNGVHLIVPADADYQTRRQVTAKVRQPVRDPKTGTYGKDKKSMCHARPVVLTDGSICFETIRVEREMHPSSSAANAVELNKIGAQMLFDTDTDSFWAVGSTS